MTYRFYSHHPDKKGWMFSNFSNHPITVDGKKDHAGPLKPMPATPDLYGKLSNLM